MLKPEIMPHSLKFAEESLQFQRHYSTGNATRFGLFGMFYGLPAYYWQKIYRSRFSPVLFQQMKQKGYHFLSASYCGLEQPGLANTSFRDFFHEPKISHILQGNQRGPIAWKGDEAATNFLIQKLQKKPSKKNPLFAFFVSRIGP